ncbi:MAG: glycosyltransferase family 4 protein [Salibacteraceae bacterium]
MKSIIIEGIVVFIAAFIITRSSIQLLSKNAIRLGLVDKPNARKIHKKPIPIIGGIAIVIGVLFAFLLSQNIQELITKHFIVLGSTLAIFLIGVWDDKVDLSPKLRLIIQLSAAIAISLSGIRIESLHGIFGIEQIPLFAQHTITVIIITGVSNAFNLVDGIDGLAGSLALLNVTILAILFAIIGNYAASLIFITFIGALIPFLTANNHPARIFMGDGGSMMLGFFTALSGIYFIQQNSIEFIIPEGLSVILISSILIIPVVDALRVFIGRYAKGNSIFTPDKSHLHHLILDFGINHFFVTNTILLIEIALVGIALFLFQFYSITAIMILLFAGLLLITKVLKFNTGLTQWQQKMKELEKRQ